MNAGPKTTPDRAFVALGSNLHPQNNLPAAVRLIRRFAESAIVSNAYENPAVEEKPPDAQNPPARYVNAAVSFLTDLTCGELVNRLRAIEQRLGRRRPDNVSRLCPIDLDLCLLAMANGTVTLPHPDIVKRAYVAVPLAELAPTLIHPGTGTLFAQIAHGLRRGSELILREGISDALRRAASDPPESWG